MKKLAAIALGLVIVVTAVGASAQMGPPTPAPELKKLDFMAGDWTIEGTLVAGPPGTPPTKFSSVDHGEWQEGNFFLVIHADVNIESMGKSKDLSVIGYDPDKKVYTNTHFSSTGQTSTSVGTVDGDTWTWTGDETYGGMSFKVKTTMKVASPTSYTMNVDMSMDGTNWMTALDAKATKK
jgi:hypothetical protein